MRNPRNESEVFGNSRAVSETGPPLEATFGEQLKWHLDWGTRPEGRPGIKGIAWRPSDFASQMGRVERNVSNWIKNKSRPDQEMIERVLFGANPAYGIWRKSLRDAFSKLPKPVRQNIDVQRNVCFLGVPSKLSNFIGQRDHLENIASVFENGDQNICVILGMGGLGKTSLAAEYAHEYKDEYAGVWWFTATTRNEATQGILRLGVYLKILKGDEKDPELSLMLCIQGLANLKMPWLLVFDNVDKPGDLEGCIPSGKIRSIVTTRFANWGAGDNIIPLNELSEHYASSLLESVAGWVDEHGAAALAKDHLGGLPLALTQAAATCRVMRITFAEYAEKVEILLENAPHNPAYPNSVFATFDLAITHAIERAPAAGKLMSFMAHCAPEPIPRVLLRGARHHEKEEFAALLMLTELSLLRLDGTDQDTASVTVHRLVQSVARTRAEENGERAGALRRLATALCQYFPTSEKINESAEGWPIYRRYFPHIVALRHRFRIDDYIIDADTLFDAGAIYALTQNRFEEAEQLARAAVNICSQRRGNEHSSIIFNTHLGEILTACFKLPEALVILNNVKRLALKETPVRRSNMFLVHLNIARIHLESGRLKEAESEYFLASNWATGEEDKLVILLAAAKLELSQRDFVNALSKYKQALKIFVNSYGEEDLRTSKIKFLVADCHLQLDEPKIAIPLLYKVLEVQEVQYGPSHSETCATLVKLGSAISEMRNGGDWRPFLSRALEGLLSAHGDINASVAGCRSAFGDALCNDLLYHEAADQYEAALSAIPPSLGDAHEISAIILSNLSKVYIDLDRIDLARPYAKRAAEGCLQLYGPAHIQTMSAHMRYAGVFEYKKDYTQAARVVLEFKTICSQILPNNDARMVTLDAIHTALLEKMKTQ